MNFLPTEEQRMAVEGFTRFLETELRPIVERYQPDKLERVNTNGDRDDCARKSPTWRSRPNNSPCFIIRITFFAP